MRFLWFCKSYASYYFGSVLQAHEELNARTEAVISERETLQVAVNEGREVCVFVPHIHRI